MAGRIFKIKRFSVHDGPGIRTSVFLKGCPLNCTWCHSPEGITSDISIWFDQKTCIACGECIKICQKNALKLVLDPVSHVDINRQLCNNNGDCVEVCPTGAIQFTGTVIRVEQVIAEIEKDLIYYRKSGGGMTLTGGEPLFQPDFSVELLSECRKRDIHTAIETSLFCDEETLKTAAAYTDLFLADLKIFDRDEHIRFTGRSNDQIKDNFKYLANSGRNIIVRIPMIKGITDTDENRNAIESFVRDIDDRIPIECIPYNPLAENNYRKLGIPFQFPSA